MRLPMAARRSQPRSPYQLSRAVAVAAALLVLAACGKAPAPAEPSSSAQQTAVATRNTQQPAPTSSAAAPATPSPPLSAQTDLAKATAELEALPVKGRAPKTGYSRDLFGDAWTDDVAVAGGHNGCDTRNDILRRDLVDVVIKPNSNGCTVLSGVLHDPYSGSTVNFERGQDTSSAVQIDHIVALSDAWQKGAQQWSDQKRADFANDPANLQATIGTLNQQKSDGDAATWLPPDKSYRCEYVVRIVGIKTAYGLWVTAAEHDAMANVLSACNGDPQQQLAPQPNTETTTSTAVDGTPNPAPPTPTVSTPDVGQPTTANTSVYFPNCKAAKAAGAAPLHAGDPGYRPGLDGDGDGVACEK